MIDNVETPAPSRDPMPDWKSNLLIGLCGLVATLAAGFMTGATVAAVEDGLAPANLILPAGGLLVAAVAGYVGWRLYCERVAEPVAPRIRSSRKTLVIGSMMGIALGLLLAISTDLSGSGSLFSNDSIPTLVAGLAILGWALGGSLLTVKWLANIDEHEMQANNAGALAGLYTYFMVEPSWWLGWRGGFLPEPQPMLTFLAVLAVYSAVWFWRRNR